MAKSIRLEILKALTKHLEGITVVNGYDHDLEGQVYRGQSFHNEKLDGKPVLSLIEPKATDFGAYADEEGTFRRDTWVILLQGWAQSDVRNPTDPVYELLADVETRLSDIVAKDPNSPNKPLWPAIYNLGGLVAGMKLSQPIVRPPEEGLSSRAFFYMPIRFTLASDITQPGR